MAALAAKERPQTPAESVVEDALLDEWLIAQRYGAGGSEAKAAYRRTREAERAVYRERGTPVPAWLLKD